MKKNFVLVFLLIAYAGVLFAQNQSTLPYFKEKQPYWWTLEKGKKFFRDGSYGDALLAFEDARNDRRAMYTKMEEDWISLLSIGEVRRLHNDLELIETYIHERSQFDAASALAEVYYRKAKNEMNNSALTVLAQFDKLKDYPEAEYWIGETYRIEGNIPIALRQYRQALKNSAALADKGFTIEIQYKIAEIEFLNQNYNAMERELVPNPQSPVFPVAILAHDEMWNQDAETINTSFVRNAMIRTLETEGIDNFIMMYRYKNTVTEKAHRMLGQYYYASGRHNKAQEHLMFAALIQNSTIIEEAISKRFDFRYSTLTGLMTEIARRNNLKEYMNDVDYYKTMYYLAASLYATGKSVSARSIWNFLASYSGAGQWQGRAATALVSPSIEKVIDMP
ncbi:MAG: hypothetical protein Ta2F_01350 [Termitinemataceae bacterium]|nr:MAG: hypothetical protein Ta2F_01350 [Termitinemataceae bacterium]